MDPGGGGTKLWAVVRLYEKGFLLESDWWYGVCYSMIFDQIDLHAF